MLDVPSPLPLPPPFTRDNILLFPKKIMFLPTNFWCNSSSIIFYLILPYMHLNSPSFTIDVVIQDKHLMQLLSEYDTTFLLLNNLKQRPELHRLSKEM
jgi:hypothetical protein